jgi:hypothetical protein
MMPVKRLMLRTNTLTSSVCTTAIEPEEALRSAPSAVAAFAHMLLSARFCPALIVVRLLGCAETIFAPPPLRGAVRRET